MKFSSTLAAVAFVAVTLAACGKKEQPAPPPAPAPAPTTAPAPAPAPVSVKQIVLGNKIGADKKVAAPATTFAPNDTIYAAVETAGTGKASLKATWTFHRDGKVAPISETVEEINASGPAQTEFHVSKPSGWPAGDYQVEVFLNGAPASSQKFTVK